MERTLSRCFRVFGPSLFCRRHLFALLPLGIWGCNAHPLKEPMPNPQQETDFSILVSPEREVDILFMVDNSPSMDPKQAALAQNFPKMIEQLQKLPGGLPDVHIGVVSSDMGAGGGELGNNCGVPLGDRGLLWGNDPTPGVRATVAGGTTSGCGLNQGARWIEDIEKADGSGRQTNYSGNLTDVFSCLAKAVGVKGCGEEHQLQSVRLALNPQTGINDANRGFLRPDAYLAVVLITDEDDCSADPYSRTNDPNHPVNNDGIFYQDNAGDTTSLRCAARGHVCNGQAIPNYDPQTGYDGSKGPFVTDFANCAAKEPNTPPDFHWLPLIPVEDLINSVVAAKGGNIQKVLVSGIIGWPENNNLAGVQYRIDKDSTSVPTSLRSLWDYMPICSIPSVTSADGNIYKA